MKTHRSEKKKFFPSELEFRSLYVTILTYRMQLCVCIAILSQNVGYTQHFEK